MKARSLFRLAPWMDAHPQERDLRYLDKFDLRLRPYGVTEHTPGVEKLPRFDATGEYLPTIELRLAAFRENWMKRVRKAVAEERRRHAESPEVKELLALQRRTKRLKKKRDREEVASKKWLKANETYLEALRDFHAKLPSHRLRHFAFTDVTRTWWRGGSGESKLVRETRERAVAAIPAHELRRYSWYFCLGKFRAGAYGASYEDDETDAEELL